MVRFGSLSDFFGLLKKADGVVVLVSLDRFLAYQKNVDGVDFVLGSLPDLMANY